MNYFHNLFYTTKGKKKRKKNELGDSISREMSDREHGATQIECTLKRNLHQMNPSFMGHT